MKALASATVGSRGGRSTPPARRRRRRPPPPRPDARGADAADGDHRDADGVDDAPGQLEVEAVAGAVAVHRGEQDLAGAPAPRTRRPRPAASTRWPRGRRGCRPPSRRRRRDGGRRWPTTTHWAPNSSASSVISSGSATAAVLTAHLVGPGPQQPAGVVGVAHAAADGQGDEDLLGRPGHHLDHGVAAVGRGGDVEKTSSSAPSAS